MDNDQVRLNKYLSESGVCSRREADRRIADGRVTVNGETATLGTRVSEQDEICVDGISVKPEEEKIILAYNKPRGIVCTSEKREPNNIIEYIGYPKRITYAGRLDKDSEGLLILTNQGSLIQEMMRGGNEHEKEYIVTVDRPVTAAFIYRLQEGIRLEELDVTTRRCRAQIVDKCTFRIILTQGLNRQIRRMCQVCGYRVRKLVRTRIMNIELGQLKTGTYRTLTPSEIAELYRLLEVKKRYE